jgi:hypothetical protein
MGLPSERHAHMSPRHICRRQRSPKCSTSRAAAIAAIVAGRDASPAAVFSARKPAHAAAAMREAA